MFRAHFGARAALALVAVLPGACALSEDPASIRLGEGGVVATGGSAVGPGGSAGSPGGRGSGGSPMFLTGGAIGTGGLQGVSKGGSGGTSGGGASGTANVGGSAKGGAGAAMGGAASGGAASGGAATGGGTGKGGSTGGASKGGAGAAVGGTASGGAATGGASASKGGAGATMGGAASGGAASGGAATGGAAMGGAIGAGGGGSTGCGACLVHRYSFAGTGTQVTDSAGTAHGTTVGATLASGSVQLSGTDQYVNLPASVLSSLSSVTIETWVTWAGTTAWQRIFDFGSNNGTTAGAQGPQGSTYLFVSPKAVSNSGKLRVAYTVNGPANEVKIDAATALPSTASTHVAVVIDDVGDTLSLYLNGAPVGSAALTTPLSSINSVNNWLGRSQFQPDPEFAGQIHEFRIYSSARSAADIQASFSAGPDAAPTN